MFRMASNNIYGKSTVQTTQSVFTIADIGVTDTDLLTIDRNFCVNIYE